MPDRRTEVRHQSAGRGVDRPHREQGDLVVELDETLDDDTLTGNSSAGRRGPPRLVDVLRTANHGLSFARRRHHRLHHARVSDLFGGNRQLVVRTGEQIRRRGQAQFFVGEASNSLAVHRGHHRGSGGDDLCESAALDGRQGVGGDGFDLGDDVCGRVLLDEADQRIAVGHIYHLGVMRDLLPGRTRVAVDSDHLDAQSLEADDQLFAEFSGAEHHHPCGGRRQWRADDVGRPHGRLRGRHIRCRRAGGVVVRATPVDRGHGSNLTCRICADAPHLPGTHSLELIPAHPTAASTHQSVVNP